jgi:hypothetical protein
MRFDSNKILLYIQDFIFETQKYLNINDVIEYETNFNALHSQRRERSVYWFFLYLRHLSSYNEHSIFSFLSIIGYFGHF